MNHRTLPVQAWDGRTEPGFTKDCEIVEIVEAIFLLEGVKMREERLRRASGFVYYARAG